MENNIFCYWSGTRFDYIDYCIKTIQKRTGCTVHLLNETNVRDYIKDGVDIHSKWSQLRNIAQRCDCMRIALLYKYGGMWIDADTIILKPLNHLFDGLKDIRLMKWTRTGRLLNGYIIAKKGSEFLKYCLDKINNTLTFNYKPVYSEHGGVLMGECLLDEINHKLKDKKLVEVISTSIFLPYEFPFNKDLWYKRLKIEQYIKSDTCAVGLNNSQYSPATKSKKVWQHINDGLLFGDIFRYSECIGKLL
jgi:hypothetical protein